MAFEILDKVPKPLLTAFAAIGFVVIAGKVVSYIQLLLDLFVLPGTNVSTIPFPPYGLCRCS